MSARGTSRVGPRDRFNFSSAQYCFNWAAAVSGRVPIRGHWIFEPMAFGLYVLLFGPGYISGYVMNRIVLIILMTLIKKDWKLRQEGKQEQRN